MVSPTTTSSLQEPTLASTTPNLSWNPSEPNPTTAQCISTPSLTGVRDDARFWCLYRVVAGQGSMKLLPIGFGSDIELPETLRNPPQPSGTVPIHQCLNSNTQSLQEDSLTGMVNPLIIEWENVSFVRILNPVPGPQHPPRCQPTTGPPACP